MSLSDCRHREFHANVKVERITDVEPMAFFANVTVTCVDCGAIMEFVGLPHGLSYSQPSTNIAATEACLPMKPQGQDGHGVGTGFSVEHFAWPERQ